MDSRVIFALDLSTLVGCTRGHEFAPWLWQTLHRIPAHHHLHFFIIFIWFIWSDIIIYLSVKFVTELWHRKLKRNEILFYTDKYCINKITIKIGIWTRGRRVGRCRWIHSDPIQEENAQHSLPVQQRPSPLQQSLWPATNVNKAIAK